MQMRGWRGRSDKCSPTISARGDLKEERSPGMHMWIESFLSCQGSNPEAEDG
jgi:hypothetical protein